jgi:hypothetical protein
MNVHEQQFAKSFITPEKQIRYLELLKSEKGRKKVRAGLYHCRDIDQRFARLLDPKDQTTEGVEQILRSKGAPERCYLFSAENDLDGREMDLSEALFEVVGSNSGTLVSCIPGKLGYFEFEDIGERYILER